MVDVIIVGSRRVKCIKICKRQSVRMIKCSYIRLFNSIGIGIKRSRLYF